ncbi:MAG: hypothetical protein R2712_12660 [Vicinamibacterales bacterium]
MALRILFTLAILAGLAAAPVAQQPFEWHAGRRADSSWAEDIGAQIERAVDRAVRAAERIAERVSTRSDRVAERAALEAERAADAVARRVERSADRVAVRAERQAERIRTRVARRIRREAWGYRGRDGGAWTDQQPIDANPCQDIGPDDDRYRHCEVREVRLPAGPLSVDANRNRGIRVEGWDGSDVLVRAVVSSHARDEAAARQLASGVEIQTGSGRVTASGPSTSGREGWSVSYRISVPRRTDLDLNARNGGISVAGVTGTITFDTTNGGVRLSDLAGRVVGRTRNGGLRVAWAARSGRARAWMSRPPTAA